jgi:hypothetical protein
VIADGARDILTARIADAILRRFDRSHIRLYRSDELVALLRGAGFTDLNSLISLPPYFVKMTSSPTATSSSMRCRPCPARPGRRPGRGRAAASSSPRQDDAALRRVLFLEDLDKQAITKRLQIRVSLPERVFLSVSDGWACLAPLTSSARVGTGTPFVGAAVPGARRLFSLPRHSAPCRCPRSGAGLHTCDAPNLSACDGEPRYRSVPMHAGLGCKSKRKVWSLGGFRARSMRLPSIPQFVLRVTNRAELAHRAARSAKGQVVVGSPLARGHGS